MPGRFPHCDTKSFRISELRPKTLGKWHINRAAGKYIPQIRSDICTDVPINVTHIVKTAGKREKSHPAVSK
jgi:hypothetical protein